MKKCIKKYDLKFLLKAGRKIWLDNIKNIKDLWNKVQKESMIFISKYK